MEPRIMWMLLSVAAACAVHMADAACKSTDVTWVAGKGPVITQPSKTEPEKIMVSWREIVEEPRCADEFTLFAWKKGQAQENGTKIIVQDNTVLSKVIMVDPCVEYYFQVESVEKDWTHTNRRQSGNTTYRTEAISQLLSEDKKNFIVSYYFDPVHRVHDLGKASVRFNRNILKNPSCVKHIEINGVEVPKRVFSAGEGGIASRTRSQSQLREAPPKGYNHHWHSGYPGGQGHWSGSVGGQGAYPGYGGHTGGQGSYPGYGGSVGGQGSHGGSHGNVVGGQGQHAGNPGWDNPGYPGYQGSPGYGYWYQKQRPDYQDTHGRKKRELAPTTTRRPLGPTTTPRPSYVVVNGKALPPFHHEMIEVTAQVKPCASYKFSLKIMTQRDSVMAEIKDLMLPLVAEMEDYHPPPLSKLFKITPPSVSGGKPIITLNPNLGVHEECLPDFFEAVDSFIGHLKDDAHQHMTGERDSRLYAASLHRKMDLQKEAQLAHSGCKCNATRLMINTTDAAYLGKSSADLYGVYQFEGFHNGKPYYRHVPNDPRAWYSTNDTMSHGRHKRFIGKVEPSQPAKPGQATTPPTPMLYSPGGTSHSSSSYSSSSSHTVTTYGPGGSTTSHTATTYGSGGPGHDPVYFQEFPSLYESAPAAPVKPVKPQYLYWDTGDKSWMVGEAMTGKHASFRTKPDTKAACPADLEALRAWQYSGTLSWKDEPSMKAACGLATSLPGVVQG